MKTRGQVELELAEKHAALAHAAVAATATEVAAMYLTNAVEALVEVCRYQQQEIDRQEGLILALEEQIDADDSYSGCSTCG